EGEREGWRGGQFLRRIQERPVRLGQPHRSAAVDLRRGGQGRHRSRTRAREDVERKGEEGGARRLSESQARLLQRHAQRGLQPAGGAGRLEAHPRLVPGERPLRDARHGAEALQIATTVKLARALWIVPLTIGTAFAFKRKSDGLENPSDIAIAWFILWFLVASVIRTYVAGPWDAVVYVARVGLTITLFLIGASLSRQSIP